MSQEGRNSRNGWMMMKSTTGTVHAHDGVSERTVCGARVTRKWQTHLPGDVLDSYSCGDCRAVGALKEFTDPITVCAFCGDRIELRHVRNHRHVRLGRDTYQPISTSEEE